MIFISHTYNDKEIVEPIAHTLAEVFGQDNVFYDSWSIQPGDGIIDKMNEGLHNCKYFFFFVSKKSLSSNMVKLEWQNAIYKATSGNAKIIPIKIDDCMMPAILMQTLYIDIYGYGIENGIRQIIDVINGRNTYSGNLKEFENLRGYIKNSSGIIDIEFRAESYLEPISQYMILVENSDNEIEYECLSDSMANIGFDNNLNIGNGNVCNGIFMGVQRGTAPNFPFKVRIKPKGIKGVKIIGLMRAIAEGKFKGIPFKFI